MTEHKIYILGIISITTAAALWGMSGVILVPRLSNLPISFVVFMQYAYPFAIMSLFFYKEMKNLRKLTKKDLAALIMIALFTGVVGTFAIVKALFLMDFRHLSVVVLLQKVQPVFAIILARFLLKEQMSKNFIYWVIFVLIFVYFMSFGLHIPELTNNNLLLACVFAIVAAMCFGSGTVFGRYLSTNLSFITITYFRYAFTSFIMLCYVLLFNDLILNFSSMSDSNWLIFTLILVSSGPLSMFLFYWGLKYVKASMSAICELSLPITAIILDFLVYDNIFSPVQWIGAAGMMYGIFKITRNQLKLEHINLDES